MITVEKTIQNNFFTTISPGLAVWGEGKLPDIHRNILLIAITEFGRATASILEAVKEKIQIGEQEVILTLPLHPDRTIEEARKLVVKATNSYRLFKIEDGEDGYRLLFRIASVEENNGKQKVSLLPANFLQSLLKSWLRLDLSELPSTLVMGVYQKAAEQLNSFIELSFTGDEAGQKPSYPDTSERCPQRRSHIRTEALNVLCASTVSLEYVKRRDVMPGKFKDNDLKGDRLICITPEWIDFVRNGTPKRFPAFFVNNTNGYSPIQLFKRRWNDQGVLKERIYAYLPLLTAKTGVLAPQPNTKSDWWHSRESEFSALPCSFPVWPAAGTGIMIPLGLDSTPHKTQSHQGWMEKQLYMSGGIGTISIKEIDSPHPGRTGRSGKKLHKPGMPKTEWKLDIALRLTSSVTLQTEVIAIHFASEPVVYWHDTHSGEQGAFQQWREKINDALGMQEQLEADQKQYKSTNKKQFFLHNRAWTRDLARTIVDQAIEKQTALVVEEITWAAKQGASTLANKKFSMWNYSSLLQAITHQANKAGILIVSIKDVSLKKEIDKKAVKDKEREWWRAYDDAAPELITQTLASMGQERIKNIIERKKEKEKERE